MTTRAALHLRLRDAAAHRGRCLRRDPRSAHPAARAACRAGSSRASASRRDWPPERPNPPSPSWYRDLPAGRRRTSPRPAAASTSRSRASSASGSASRRLSRRLSWKSSVRCVSSVAGRRSMLPSCRRNLAGDQSQQGGLAGAARPDDGEAFAASKRQRHIPKRRRAEPSWQTETPSS